MTTIDDLRDNYDPVTLEVIRMRLDNIVEEMGIAMIRSSGSPVITEARDYNTALFDAEGRIYSYSDAVQLHIGSGGVAVRNLLATVGPDEIRPGDSFISNDPHTAGSSHPPDTTVISPIFLGDRLVGFAQSQAHLVDVGGMAPGGFAPAATDCFGEALRLPPGVKIFDRGEPVESVRRLIANNVRTPVLHWNDVRSMVAANNTGIRRFLETIEEFGHETFASYTALSFELAEQVLRDRIRDIPNGIFESEDWVEGNGHDDVLYRVACRMTVEDSQITFDFEGSSPQTDGFVNCSYGALVGSIASAVVPTLGWDVPFNEGVMTAFKILAPEGTIVNPLVPAPISNGHLTTGVRATRLVTRLLNQAVVASDNSTVRQRTQGEWGDSWTGGISSGLRGENGEFFVWFNMDGGGMGTGAQVVRDGHDAAGLLTQIGNMLPDVEMNEMIYPALYLWKRLATDSPGHGASRGGMGLDYAWVLWGADESAETLFCPTAAVPPWGFAGGLPAGGSGFEFLRNTNIKELLGSGTYPTPERLNAAVSELQEPNAQGLVLRSSDVFHSWLGGGGGFGDPLLRDPRLVVQDVHDAFVSAEHAGQIYGVVLTDDEDGYDAEATSIRRSEIRSARLREAGRSDEARELVNPRPDLVEDVLVPSRNDQGEWTCPACSSGLGAGDNWLDGTLSASYGAYERLTGLGVRLRERSKDGEEVRMDEHLCPACATLLHSSIRVATA
ncbi:hydantoinase B/oxoprolinase family protein [Streptomyces sp. PSKA54]|uniref:Hydantoinase B/oxoprolinase family protein n=1 Tax=Streptomyces himalayensis subsp. aureolus TaxID=2758039 RepID=A0A7W2D9L5_9ACTN|nr:hydantoinase B/oxoprolinase family protein [Streptomyces himalayensis]MBA4867146.1 hydantoinase B/oxoprolinase family protein [Streptomyces himalayensis subsp. aureolus]